MYSGETLSSLQRFRKREKFAINIWNSRGLNPSSDNTCTSMEKIINDCTDDLIVSVTRKGSKKEVKKILSDHLFNIKKIDYDTEEREFLMDYFSELSRIVDVPFSHELNKWLYGSFMALLVSISKNFRKKSGTFETLSQPCTECENILGTFIFSRSTELQDEFWQIIQCNNCSGYSLLSLYPEINQFKPINYYITEQLQKTDYTAEEAQTRLEQIKYFRKK